jgi:hypothetical protein
MDLPLDDSKAIRPLEAKQALQMRDSLSQVTRRLYWLWYRLLSFIKKTLNLTTHHSSFHICHHFLIIRNSFHIDSRDIALEPFHEISFSIYESILSFISIQKAYNKRIKKDI